jgi:hypothetical protein
MKSKPLSDDELRALTDLEMRSSVGYWAGKLANQRQKAMQYYLAEPVGDLAPPEVDGRSSIVVPLVRNTIESMLPQLMVKFAGSERVVEFEPNKPGDEQAAEQATDYVSFIYNTRCDGERISYTWMKDALISKNGIIKVWWDTRTEEKREEYKALSDVELAQLMDDEEIEVTEQNAYPDEEDAKQRQQALEQIQPQMAQAMEAAQQGNQQAMQAVQQFQAQIEQITQAPEKMLFDVVCKRVKQGGKIQIDNVPPEEFLINRDAKSIETARFVAHRVQRTISDLKSMGYKDVDDISGDDQSTSTNMERITRLQYDDEMAANGQDVSSTVDDSQKRVWVTECYIRVDADGDGISELRKITRAGTKLLDNEIVDCAPFVSITPVPMPHKFFGLSVADLAMEGMRMETSLVRANFDNTYLSVNGRYFAVEGQVNLDDLLTSRPGGIVRLKAPGMAGRLDQGGGDMQSSMAMLEYVKGFNEDSTGWTRYNQGTDGDSLNNTATGVNIVTNRADMRLDLIARNFATGFRDLFNMILKLVSQNATKEDMINLRGTWVPIDPREWRNGFTATINVGLGTGNRDQQIKQLMALLNEQKQGMQFGIATPMNVYAAEQELVKALGFKNGDKFWTDPAKNPPPQQPPLPLQIEQMKIQADAQKHQAQTQADIQKFQAETQMTREIENIKAQAKVQEVQANLELQRSNDERDAQREMVKAQYEVQLEQQRMEFEKWKAELQAQTQIYLAQLSAGSTQPVETDGNPENVSNALAASIDGFRQALETMNRPKTIIRGPDGRAAGIA